MLDHDLQQRSVTLTMVIVIFFVFPQFCVYDYIDNIKYNKERNINRPTITYIQARFAIVIFINNLMLLFGHHLHQLTKPPQIFIKIFIVLFAVDDVYIALCLIMIYNNAQ